MKYLTRLGVVLFVAWSIISSAIAAPPAGFVSLFNGQDLAGWKGLVAVPIKRARMSADELAAAQQVADERMRAHWQHSSRIQSV